MRMRIGYFNHNDAFFGPPWLVADFYAVHLISVCVHSYRFSNYSVTLYFVKFFAIGGRYTCMIKVLKKFSDQLSAIKSFQ